MADVSHELDALRFVVESPLSAKVAKFNNQVQMHKNSQLQNPFSDDHSGMKPTFSKDEYGKPLAGSLTEMRGQKANMHVLKEMQELCQIINSEGYPVKNAPEMRVIPFGELFNIYNYISDKVVGILLRARKHKLVEFEGEMLFQRRDDDVPIFLLKPIREIKTELDVKINDIKRAVSPTPQSTSVILDKTSRNEQHASLKAKTKSNTKTRSPTSSPPLPLSPEQRTVAVVPQDATPNAAKQTNTADVADVADVAVVVAIGVGVGEVRLEEPNDETVLVNSAVTNNIPEISVTEAPSLAGEESNTATRAANDSVEHGVVPTEHVVVGVAQSPQIEQTTSQSD